MLRDCQLETVRSEKIQVMMGSHDSDDDDDDNDDAAAPGGCSTCC